MCLTQRSASQAQGFGYCPQLLDDYSILSILALCLEAVCNIESRIEGLR